MFHEYAIAFGLIALHIVAFWAIRRYKLEKRTGFATFAIFIMWKTQKGKRLIERLGRRKLRPGEAQPLEGPKAWTAARVPQTPVVVAPRDEATQPQVYIDGAPEAAGRPVAPKVEKSKGGEPDPNLGTAPRRFWHVVGDLASAFFIVFMIGMVALLLWEATVVPQIPRDRAPSPQMALGLPGINPVIPVGYGILGLAVAIIVHEFAHGVLARAEGMKVRSLGLLFFALPIGAFVEPDEDELRKAPRRRRMRVYAAGASSNFLTALICLVLFIGVFTSSVEPRERGAAIIGIVKDTQAARAGLLPWELVTDIDGTRIDSVAALASKPDFVPGAPVTVKGLYRGEPIAHANATAGLSLTLVVDGLPAARAGLEPGMILYSVSSAVANDTIVANQESLSNRLGLQKAGDIISIKALEWDGSAEKYVMKRFDNITLADRGKYYKERQPSLYDPKWDGKPFLGITSAYMGILAADPEAILAPMKTPFAGVRDPGSFFIAGLQLMTFPLAGYSPVDSPMADLFIVRGPLGAMPAGAFWTLANSLYWIFWLNLMVGLTNVLPLALVDGSHFYRDVFGWIVSRRVKDPVRVEGYERKAVIGSSLLVFGLIVWQFVGPYLF